MGYYGFASLNNSKNHYDHIINIDGVYLKYFKEINNIYYGAFVLDSLHGVRYADTSRYYIIKENDTWGRVCLLYTSRCV